MFNCVRNALLDNFKLGATHTFESIPEYEIQQTVDFMVDYAIEQGLTTKDDALLYETKLFGLTKNLLNYNKKYTFIR